jgi:hypothetical protein
MVALRFATFVVDVTFFTGFARLIAGFFATGFFTTDFLTAFFLVPLIGVKASRSGNVVETLVVVGLRTVDGEIVVGETVDGESVVGRDEVVVEVGVSTTCNSAPSADDVGSFAAAGTGGTITTTSVSAGFCGPGAGGTTTGGGKVGMTLVVEVATVVEG